MKESSKYLIEINNVTKNYGKNRGNFDINLKVKEGETLGIVGDNGAGKTTLMRQLMGFIRSDKGNINIAGFDAYENSKNTKKLIGYIPGEINFPDVKTGIEFLHNFGDSLGATEKDYQYANELIKRIQLDVRAYPKRMSKGMKQKTSIVAALMRKPKILFLDEPSIGLDPLMREELLQMILEQKENGSTIIMSSNSIEELERVSDRVALIKNGKIVDIADMNEIRNRTLRDYKFDFKTEEDYKAFQKLDFNIIRLQDEFNQVTVRIEASEVNKLFKALNNYQIRFISEIQYNLASYFKERRMKQDELQQK